ncbi:GNAT family N-acetyltransferase [Imtechella halotolerans]|uniref:N-acetyltransferase domain-containing protein n=1 Tax=Imtechella halotolerans K1 TaxID=946077 RepID=I0WGG0_9FLAO|nr:N-acetyltransferase [Imtechella halotolerans]EID75476.1 hypothetical protein W5A_04658 [Imtechella halotolerans K1]WMQ63694.1 N-acetyltransferase [Imtechella halotolerans]
MNALLINDNEFLRQFEVKHNDELASIEYSLQDRKIFLTKLNLPENTDNEFEGEFIKSVLENIQEKNLRVVPTSPEIAKFLRKHKEFKDLLPVGIRI